jgi:predicted extracellular nuclease
MIRVVLILFVIVITVFSSCDTVKIPETKKKDVKIPDYRIMFYNVENLFDTKDDTLKNDEQFLPYGDKRWTWEKYTDKTNKIAKVITAVGEWGPPVIVGVCEIENYYVLNGIVKYSPLLKHDYKIIHYDSPDRRGIDVAMLYLSEKFKPIKHHNYKINFPFNKRMKTRDILYVKGETNKNDTLHIFINHWPSRWGGQVDSEPKREFAASVLRNIVDSIQITDKDANIIIIGDLNDEPEDKSVKITLNAKLEYDNIKSLELYNLSYYLQSVKNKGSHKYQGKWGMLDHIIISGSLLNENNKIHTTKDDAHVFDAKFLLETDSKYQGFTPFRTYKGFKYNAGFSDHLPIYIDLYRKK